MSTDKVREIEKKVAHLKAQPEKLEDELKRQRRLKREADAN